MSFNRFGRSSSSSRSYSRNNSRSRSRNRNASKENTTIWVGGLGGNDPQDVDTLGKILKNVFSDYGRVVDVKMRSTTHDLFAFVQFESHNAAVTAIKKMDQQEVQGRRVKVSWAQFKGSGGRSKQESYRIWVGRIGSSTNENQLRNSFEEFGVITDVKIRSNDKDTFAFIQFQGQRNADRAIKEMNNTRFRGNTIKCDWAQYKNRQQSNGGGKRAPSPRRSNTKFRVDSRSSSRRRSRSYSNNRDDQRFQVTTGESPSAGKKEPTGSPKSKSPPKYYSQSRSKSPSGTPPRVAKISPPKETEATAPPKKADRSKSASPPRVVVRPHILEMENLPPEVKKDDLKDVGNRYGGENSVSKVKVWSTGNNINNGMLEFTDRGSLQDCFLCLHKRRINGYRLKVFLR